MSKILIAYFLRKNENYSEGRIVNLDEGNTAIAAKMIQVIHGGDLYEIKPMGRYSVDYDTCIQQGPAGI